MSIWFASLVAIGALLLPFIAVEGQARPSDQKNVTTIVVNAANSTSVRAARAVKMPELLEARVVSPSKMMTGDSVGLETALDSQRDLMTSAGEHKKYILVKKKPKHKKIKMEVFKPKMKYKKIKMKVPVKKMKKKKVKGYLVKKEKHYH